MHALLRVLTGSYAHPHRFARSLRPFARVTTAANGRQGSRKRVARLLSWGATGTVTRNTGGSKEGLARIPNSRGRCQSADARYGPLAAEVRELIWSVAGQSLRAGIDVVLDWNCWSIARRTWATQRARAVGANVVMHNLTTPLEESVRRAEQRDAVGEVYSHRITLADNEHLAGLLEDPSTAEGIRIVEH